VYGGFRLQYTAFRNQRTLPILYLSDEDQPDADGASLAAEFLKMAQSKGIELDANELDDDDEEEEEESDDTGIPEEEEEEDRSGLTVTLTDDKLYSEVKERVLDTAGGFVEFVKGAKDEDDEASEEDEEVKPKVYEPPSKVPGMNLRFASITVNTCLHHYGPARSQYDVLLIFIFSQTLH
jgi:hypothetical protein